MNISCTLPMVDADEVRGSARAAALVSAYPPIQVKRENSIGVPIAPTTSSDRRILMTPTNETLFKRLSRIYFEEGLEELLDEIEARTLNSPRQQFILKCVKYFVDRSKQLNSFINPRNEGTRLIEEFAQTRDFQKSLIRFMSWHPNVFRLAVAINDDSVRVYSVDNSNIPILRNGQQKLVTCLAWRPLAASELAVGCFNGVILWKLDVSNNLIRPTSQYQYLKQGNHRSISSLQWNHMGTLLATSSVNNSDVIIWNVDTNKSTPLKRIGLPASLLFWSPNSQLLFASTIGNVFRVWNTDKWSPERWTIPKGSIQSAAWSPCSNHLIFITTSDTILYRLCFVDEQLYQTSTAPKQSFPIADFAQVARGQCEVGGLPKSICWDSTGKFIAVMFKESPSIAIFSTTINRNMVHISPSFFVRGEHIENEFANFICFKENNCNGQVVLAIGWSTGRIQYFLTGQNSFQ